MDYFACGSKPTWFEVRAPYYENVEKNCQRREHYCVQCAAVSPIGVLFRLQIGLEYGFENQNCRPFRCPIADSGYPYPRAAETEVKVSMSLTISATARRRPFGSATSKWRGRRWPSMCPTSSKAVTPVTTEFLLLNQEAAILLGVPIRCGCCVHRLLLRYTQV